MRLSEALIAVAAIVAALPFGWGLGVLAALLIAGKDFGQLPILTVPIGLVVAIVFAVRPSMPARRRLKILLAGDALFVLLAWLAR